MMNGTGSRRCEAPIFLLFLVCLSLVLPTAAHAQAPEVITAEQENTQDKFDSSQYLILWRAMGEAEMASELESFTRYILQNLRTAMERDGYRLADTLRNTDSTKNLGEAAFAAGVLQRIRWVFTVDLALEAQRLSWRMAAYDAERKSLRSSEIYAAYPGLSVLPALDEAVSRLLQDWKSAIALDAEVLDLTERSQVFKAKQNGVEVWYGPHGEGILAGTISSGTLEALYLPFPEKSPLYVELYKDGYWPKSLVLPKGVTDKPVMLPALQKKAVHVWGVGTEVGKLLGATYLYRYYPLPDRLYFRFDNALWAGYSFLPGAIPIFHDEVRFGLGLYLQSRTDFPLRISIGTGGSAIFSVIPPLQDAQARSALDILLDPLWVTLEWHFPVWAFVTEFRLPYATGSGFINQGWISAGEGGPFVSVGVLIK
ncbi:MAG: hypothetical protein LDL24_02335 [Treponema sp.]|nr:hypothetical protein [Treponema sp.]